MWCTSRSTFRTIIHWFHPFNKTNHFSPEGHALFAKFLTDTDTAQASVDYYSRQ